jgi:hypothetical protein
MLRSKMTLTINVVLCICKLDIAILNNKALKNYLKKVFCFNLFYLLIFCFGLRDKYRIIFLLIYTKV